MRLGLGCFIGVIALFACGDGHAQNIYPTRSVRIVVPVGPSGPSDTIARLIAEKLSQKLGQPFIVENQAGAANNIGIANVARGPDGYTILLVGSNFTINPALFAKIPYDPIKDFEPVMIAATSPAVLITNPSIPATNLKEPVTYLKANPRKYSYASPGSALLAICLANSSSSRRVLISSMCRSTARAPSFSRCWAIKRRSHSLQSRRWWGWSKKANCVRSQ
jgi:tripartite-type tricarboxylate transporter receptor subunit TctC